MIKLPLLLLKESLRIVGNIDVKSLEEKGNGRKLRVEEINTYAKAVLMKGNSKIADVKYEEESDKGVIYFIFSDGSREKAEKYVSDFEDRVTKIFKRFDRK